MKIKKLIAIFALLLCAILLTACQDSPSDAVKKAIKDFQKSETSTGELALSDEAMDEEILLLYGQVLDKEKDFDYDILSEDIAEDGKTAVVTVSLSTYDFGLAYLDTWDEIIESGNTDEQNLYKTMFNKMLELEEKSYTAEVAINCTMKDGKWTADLAGNSDFSNAIFGGVPQLVEEFAQL